MTQRKGSSFLFPELIVVCLSGIVFSFFASDRFQDGQITILNYFDHLASSPWTKLHIGGQIQGNSENF